MAAALWFSLGEMSPQTRCIYALPAHADPAFGRDLGSRAASKTEEKALRDADATDVSDGFWSSFGQRFDVFLLPSAAEDVRGDLLDCGDALLCSHRLLHWRLCPSRRGEVTTRRRKQLS